MFYVCLKKLAKLAVYRGGMSSCSTSGSVSTGMGEHNYEGRAGKQSLYVTNRPPIWISLVPPCNGEMNVSSREE